MTCNFSDAAKLFELIQDKTLKEIETITNLKQTKDNWQYQNGDGGGRTIVAHDEKHFDQVSINYSNISGDNLIPSAVENKPELLNANFKASGVSIIVHPKNPHAPTTHANFRLFKANLANGKSIWWFGGGFDLTPYYPYLDDCVKWHSNAYNMCSKHHSSIYDEFKKNCDEYFFLPHRKEPRGIGGLFFDNLNRWEFEKCLSFIKDASDTFISSYMSILRLRINTPYGRTEELFKLYRRSRYVEFNLLYDRGTKFGIESKGRINSIFASLPPVVHWNYSNNSYNKKQELYLMEFLKVKHWLHK